MTENKETNKELNYFFLTLKDYLRSSFPEMLNNDEFIHTRSQNAAETYADALKNGMTQEEASSEANDVLFEDLHFSKFDTVMDVLTEEFTEELGEDEFRPFAMQMLPVCEEVFSRYELNNDIAYSAEYEMLYTEITGAIQIYIEENGIHFEEGAYEEDVPETEHLKDENAQRESRDGKRIGDKIKFMSFPGKEITISEVVGYYPADSNRIYVKSKEGTIIDIYASWCEITTPVEERKDTFSLLQLEDEIISAFKSLISLPNWYEKADHPDGEAKGKEAVRQFNAGELPLGAMYYWLEICRTKLW